MCMTTTKMVLWFTTLRIDKQTVKEIILGYLAKTLYPENITLTKICLFGPFQNRRSFRILLNQSVHSEEHIFTEKNNFSENELEGKSCSVKG